MRCYLIDLGERTVGAFAAALVAQLPENGFDVRAWPWSDSLSLAGSIALVVLLAGVAARYRGDRDSAGFTK
ncbi:holin [Streptomyces sp. NPDC007863]|uniref:holin n=1 Tax=Streptomyces sp. NPDC007863 TaxID=3154894 RepID=UPI0033C70DF9